LPHASFVSTADVTDRKGAIFAIGYAREHLSNRQTIMADSGYTGESFSLMMKKLIGAKVTIIKRNELHKFLILPIVIQLRKCDFTSTFSMKICL